MDTIDKYINYYANEYVAKKYNDTINDTFVDPFYETNGAKLNFIFDNTGTIMQISMLYIIVIFALRKFIKSLKNPNILDKPLKPFLCMWNMSLTLFSLVGTYYMVPYLWNRYNMHGFVDTVCSQHYTNDRVYLHIFVFVISKVPELIDTLFIVLRNKPLIFLQWYHHLVTLLYCWYSASAPNSNGGVWFATMNYFVHAIMYAYFAFSCYVKIGGLKLLTFLQISQMVVGLVVLYVNVTLCETYDIMNIIFAVIMYASFLYLFVIFYKKKYYSSGLSQKRNNNKK